MTILDLKNYYDGDIHVFKAVPDSSKKYKFSIIDIYEGDINDAPDNVLSLMISTFYACGIGLEIRIKLNNKNKLD